MRRKCRNCLCRTCMKSCKCGNCKGKIKECKRYSGFRQLSIFEPPPDPEYRKAPRHSWEHYGINRQRYKELVDAIRSGTYEELIHISAYRVNKLIAEYILLSVKQNLSYEGLQRLWDLKEIKRMPCGRSDFYGWRREFYSLFDGELRKIGK